MRVRVDNVGQIGIIRDRQPIELPPNAWSDGLNMMFRAGYAESRRGILNKFDSIKGTADYITSFVRGPIDFIYAGDRRIFTFSGGATSAGDIVDRTRTAGAGGIYAAGRRWQHTYIGSIPIMFKPNIGPQYLGVSASTFDTLPNIPINFRAKVMIEFHGYLIAMNVNEGGAGSPPVVTNLIRWSNRAEVNAVPTTWDYTDPTNDAGRVQIGEESDEILTAKVLRGALYIYRSRSIWRCTFIGGAFVFQFEPVFENTGVAEYLAVDGDENFHYIFTNDADLVAHDGVTMRSVLDDKNKDFVRETMDKTFITHVMVHYDRIRDEIILGFRQPGESGNNVGLVINVSTGSQTFRNLPFVRNMTYGELSYSDAALTHWWSEGADSGNVTEFRNLMAGGSMIYLDDYGYEDPIDPTQPNWVFNDPTPIDSALIREELPFHQFGVDHNKIIEIKTIYPRIEAVNGSTRKVNVYIIAKDRPEQSITEAGVKKGPFVFDIDNDYKVDCRVACRYPGIIFEVKDDENEFQWRITGYDIEFDVSGHR